MNKAQTTKKLVTSAMMVALGTAISFLCEMIPFLNLPFGGTVTVASLLPLILIGYLYGPAWGFGSSFVYSIIQIAVGYRTVAGMFTPTSDSYMGARNALFIILIDYILAFTAVGLASLWRKLKPLPGLVLGSITGLLACYLFHVLSGAIFYGAWAEWFFTDTVAQNFAVSAWIMAHFSGAKLAVAYSIVYNGCYMIPEIVITSLAAAGISTVPTLMREKTK